MNRLAVVNFETEGCLKELIRLRAPVTLVVVPHETSPVLTAKLHGINVVVEEVLDPPHYARAIKRQLDAYDINRLLVATDKDAPTEVFDLPFFTEHFQHIRFLREFTTRGQTTWLELRTVTEEGVWGKEPILRSSIRRTASELGNMGVEDTLTSMREQFYKLVAEHFAA